MLAYAARQVGTEAPLAEASDRTNELTKARLVEKVKSMVAPGATIAILGLSYKPDTYIIEESAGLYLAQALKRAGSRIVIHDFAANSSNNPALAEFEMISNLASLTKRNDIDLAVICCPWPQYAGLKLSAQTKLLPTWQL